MKKRSLLQKEKRVIKKPNHLELDIHILLKDQIDYSKMGLEKMGPEEKGVAVLTAAMEVAKKTQNPLIELIQALGLSYQTYYVQNSIFVDNVSVSDIKTLDSHESVGEIQSNRAFKVQLEEPESFVDPKQSNVEWNLDFCKASNVWKKNITGRGFTVANADTGIQWDHEGLKFNYRGFKDGVVNHSYHWWDGVRTRINPRGNRCGYNLTAPCDDHG